MGLFVAIITYYGHICFDLKLNVLKTFIMKSLVMIIFLYKSFVIQNDITIRANQCTKYTNICV